MAVYRPQPDDAGARHAEHRAHPEAEPPAHALHEHGGGEHPEHDAQVLHGDRQASPGRGADRTSPPTARWPRTSSCCRPGRRLGSTPGGRGCAACARRGSPSGGCAGSLERIVSAAGDPASDTARRLPGGVTRTSREHGVVGSAASDAQCRPVTGACRPGDGVRTARSLPQRSVLELVSAPVSLQSTRRTRRPSAANTASCTRRRPVLAGIATPTAVTRHWPLNSLIGLDRCRTPQT